MKYRVAIGRNTKIRDVSEMKRKEMSFQDFAERFDEPQIRAEKDGTALLIADLNPNGPRRDDAIRSRSMFTVDIEKTGDPYAFSYLCMVLENMGTDYVIHTTHSHEPENPRVRIYIPLAEPITSKQEYEAKAEKFIYDHFPEEWIDPSCTEWNRLMYAPAIRDEEAEYLVSYEYRAGPLDASEIPADFTSQKKQGRQDSLPLADMLKDPRKSANGLIRAFCTAYDIRDAIAKFLPDVYAPSRQRNRYDYLDGSAEAGLMIVDDYHAYPFDATDPARLNKNPNTGKTPAYTPYDLVRLHKFGNSKRSMNAMIREDPLVIAELEKQKEAEKQAKKEEAVKEIANMSQDELAKVQKVLPTDPQYLEEKTEGVSNLKLRNIYSVEMLAKRFLEETANQFEPIPTGFEELDKLLDGGLYAGTYYIGAISSLGKTTIALAIADQIARQGNDVIFFTLEMSPMELMAKSVSRYSAMKLLENPKKYKSRKRETNYLDGALQVNEILRREKLKAYPVKDDLFWQAYRQYVSDLQGRLLFAKADSPMDVRTMKAYVAQHVAHTGKRPVVFVDYLQVIKPESDRMTDKAATDANVLALKELSVAFNIPVVTISSFNRASYMSPVSPESFKESGNIEYGADVLIGIQFAGMDYQQKYDRKEKVNRIETDREREKRVKELMLANQQAKVEGRGQEIEIKVLKNRRYITDGVRYFLYPKYNLIADTNFDE